MQHVSLFTSPYGRGWLPQWCDARDEHGEVLAQVMHATSYDNIRHLGRAFIDEMEVDFPPGTKEHAQEMLGQFVSRTGLVYGDVFTREAHMVDWQGDVYAPYVLTVDPGYRASAWLVWQRRATPETGPQWIVVDEYLADAEITEDSARHVKQLRAGRQPVKVFLDTPSRQNSRLHLNDAEAIEAVIPRAKVRVLGGYERTEDWRHKSVIAGLVSGRLKVSDRIAPTRIRHKERGLVHALESTEWPDESTRKETRSKTDERWHVLDALEFGASVLTPPKSGRTGDRAARYRASVHAA